MSTLTDRDRAVGLAGVADARHELERARCPGTGQLAGTRAATRCAHCREQVATELLAGYTTRTLVEHTAPVRPPRVCFLDGCDRLTPSPAHRWCSTAHHRLDEYDEYDDRLAEA